MKKRFLIWDSPKQAIIMLVVVLPILIVQTLWNILRSIG